MYIIILSLMRTFITNYTYTTIVDIDFSQPNPNLSITIGKCNIIYYNTYTTLSTTTPKL